MKSVALTGATGFIGNALLKYLVGHGFRVKALYRPSSSPPLLSSDAIQWHAGNLESIDSLRAFVADADAVIHCAGVVRGTTSHQFENINRDGVARLLQASVELGVQRFLLISSLAAREPSLSHYASSKRLGEDVLFRAHGAINWDILRPPAVYGPGDREMLPLLKMISRGIIPVIGEKEGRFSLLYVDDLASAVGSLLKTKSLQHGRCFELHDGQPGGYSWRQISEIARRLNGRNPRCFSIPRPLLQLVGVTNAMVARVIGYQPMLTPGKVREIFHSNWVCDNTAISEAIDWQPQVSFREGMRRLFYS